MFPDSGTDFRSFHVITNSQLSLDLPGGIPKITWWKRKTSSSFGLISNFTKPTPLLPVMTYSVWSTNLICWADPAFSASICSCSQPTYWWPFILQTIMLPYKPLKHLSGSCSQPLSLIAHLQLYDKGIPAMKNTDIQNENLFHGSLQS